MEYNYEEKKKWLNTVAGTIAFYRGLCETKKLITLAGACKGYNILSHAGLGLHHEARCILDRIVELGFVREIEYRDKERKDLSEVPDLLQSIYKTRDWSHRLFIAGDDFDTLVNALP